MVPGSSVAAGDTKSLGLKEGNMENIDTMLQKAIAAGQTIRMIYNGGSRPGETRLLIPISLSATDLVAREPSSRRTKTFKLKKVAAVDLQDGECAINPEVQPVPVEPEMLAPLLETFEEYVAHFKGIICEKSFNIIEEENYFGISGRFKNGKPRKTPIASIQYIDRTIEYVYDPDVDDFVEQKKELTCRERPWRVDSAQFEEGKSFSKLQKAADLFLRSIPATE